MLQNFSGGPCVCRRPSQEGRGLKPGDTGEGSWRETRDKFKAKWFTELGRKDRIEKYLRQMASEVFDSFGFGYYCRDCVEWTPKDNSLYYGKCNLNKNCLVHRGDYCDKFEEKRKQDG